MSRRDYMRYCRARMAALIAKGDHTPGWLWPTRDTTTWTGTTDTNGPRERKRRLRQIAARTLLVSR